MSAHTPGPWAASVEENLRGGWVAPTKDVDIWAGDVLIASFDCTFAEYPDDETIEANARLIAAAPELLEALEQIVTGLHYPMATANEREAVQVARAAIAKAQS